MNTDKPKIIIKILIVITALLLIAGGVMFFMRGKQAPEKEDPAYSWAEKGTYIAHALGGIDGNAYTNSREALEASYKAGYRNIEADFEYSSDGELVLIHNFKKKTLKDLFGMEIEEDEKALSSEEFLSLKVCGKYTTMTLKELMEFMKDHGDMYLILDGKYEEEEEVKREYKDIVSLAEKIDPEILNRMVPQIYNGKMYDWIMEAYEWPSVIFTWYRLNDEELDPEEIFGFCKNKGIKICTMEDEKENPLIDRTAAEYGVRIFVHTINDEEAAERLFSSGVYGIYTDFLIPEQSE